MEQILLVVQLNQGSVVVLNCLNNSFSLYFSSKAEMQGKIRPKVKEVEKPETR